MWNNASSRTDLTQPIIEIVAIADAGDLGVCRRYASKPDWVSLDISCVVGMYE